VLDLFWHSHNPCRAAYSTQYRSAIFYHNDEQKKIAFETMKNEEARRGKIQTAIVPATEFYLAEDYHQKYALRNAPELMEEFKAIYPKLNDFVNSTAAARINGYIHGSGSIAQFEKEAPTLGLSDNGLIILRRYMR
jgi:peptide-methionine (S)-S-oxide reductase